MRHNRLFKKKKMCCTKVEYIFRIYLRTLFNYLTTLCQPEANTRLHRPTDWHTWNFNAPHSPPDATPPSDSNTPPSFVSAGALHFSVNCKWNALWVRNTWRKTWTHTHAGVDLTLSIGPWQAKRIYFTKQNRCHHARTYCT